MISSLYQYGLFTVQSPTQLSANFVLSDFGKALKQNCRNFNDELTAKRIAAFDEVSPLNILETASNEAIEEMLNTL